MTRYLIEVPHKADRSACEQAIRVFNNTGSHLLMKADWGCLDGEHKAWFFMDTDNKEQALGIIPPLFRKQAKIIRLIKFSLDEKSQISANHEK